jgi:hypothetical protein
MRRLWSLEVVEDLLGEISQPAPDRPLLRRVAELEKQVGALSLNVDWLTRRAMQDLVNLPLESDEPNSATH